MADPAIVARNRRNKRNGRSTTQAVADYLGLDNVEWRGLPWDAQGRGTRLQSKREKAPLSLARAVRLIDYIDPSDSLRVLFHVRAGQRLASGRVLARMEEWCGWHGWQVPVPAELHNVGGVPLIEMPLPTFRDVHVGLSEEDQDD